MFIFCFISERNINILNKAKKIIAIQGYAFLDLVTNNNQKTPQTIIQSPDS